MSMSEPKNRPGNDWSSISEQQWLTLSIVFAIFTAISFGFAFGWVFFSSPDALTMQQKSAALAPFGLAFFAIVSFFTVGWRGAISTRQLNASENENRARLLQEGAKLLADDKATNINAGIATLEILITGEDEKFAVQAMNLLADYVQRNFVASHELPHADEAFAALSSGEKHGRKSTRTLKFKAVVADGSWKFVEGVESVSYQGGYFESRFGNVRINEKKNCVFTGVMFRFVRDLSLDMRFYQCSYILCEIVRVEDDFISDHLVDPLKFDRCNFSECIFVDFKRIPDLREKDNHYVNDKLPTVLLDGVSVRCDWNGVLNQHERQELF
jgi:hypothetical protein